LDKITALFNEHGEAIHNFCQYLAKNKHDGEDLFQETFLRAMEISEKIDKQNNPKSYLISIAINLWNNTIQKRARRKRIAPTVDIENDDSNIFIDFHHDTEADTINKIMIDTLVEAVKKLDDKYRIPIILFYAEDMKISEISKVLSKPEGTIKRRLHEAKNKLKKEMEDNGYGG
jgi:RNA polymerase sigma-70 factor (ECF subfamily)